MAMYPPPPPAAGQPAAGGPSGPRASFGRRLVGSLIDGILVGTVTTILRVAIHGGPGVLLEFAIGAAYFTVLIGSSRGQTLGQMALGIRVIDFSSGGPIGYGRAFVRWLVSIVSAIPCFLGYFWMLWDKEKQCWHDKAANDVVVPVQYYPVN